jgi:cystathionine beta-lyase/cystathionine gamma-synthase
LAHIGHSMAMTRDRSNRLKGGFATRAIDTGHNPADHLGALTPPVFMTSTYAFETAKAGEQIFRGERQGYVYGRTCNRTQALLEKRITSLENAEAGLRRSRHGCDQFDLIGCAAGGRRGRYRSCSLWLDAGALLIVNHTFTTPALQQPILLGADLVVYSATKFIGGHGDLIVSIVAGPKEIVEHIKRHGLCYLTGATIAPLTAFLLLRGLKDTGAAHGTALLLGPGHRAIARTASCHCLGFLRWPSEFAFP